MGTKTISNY